MEYLILAIIILIFVIILKIVFKINIKEIKKAGDNKRLDELTKKYPENVSICKWYLNKLNNNRTKIEENLESKNSMYIAITDKIIIANIKESYTRIQTIAHECLHSIQDRRLLNFNFIFSNIYLIYFAVIIILAICRILPNKMVFLAILIILGLIYFLVRAYLENDAMIKAKYLAKEYMESIKISSKEEIEEIVKEYDKLNNIGIKGANYSLFLGVCIKIIIFLVLCFAI